MRLRVARPNITVHQQKLRKLDMSGVGGADSSSGTNGSSGLGDCSSVSDCATSAAESLSDAVGALADAIGDLVGDAIGALTGNDQLGQAIGDMVSSAVQTAAMTAISGAISSALGPMAGLALGQVMSSQPTMSTITDQAISFAGNVMGINQAGIDAMQAAAATFAGDRAGIARSVSETVDGLGFAGSLSPSARGYLERELVGILTR
jgi:hypothetical protein